MKNKLYYYSAVSSIIAIKTNIKDFSFSYGMAMPYVDEKEYNNSLIKIDLEVVSGSIVPKEGEKPEMGKFHYFSGFQNANEMYYERSFFLVKNYNIK